MGSSERSCVCMSAIGIAEPSRRLARATVCKQRRGPDADTSKSLAVRKGLSQDQVGP